MWNLPIKRNCISQGGVERERGRETETETERERGRECASVEREIITRAGDHP